MTTKGVLQMSVKPSYIITDGVVTLVDNFNTYTVTESHTYFEEIIDAIREEDFTEALRLIDLQTSVSDYANGIVTVKDGRVYYEDEEIHNALTIRLLKMMEEGFSIEPMANFLRNLMDNPSGRAVQELYRFLESNTLPITPDGYFLAYKNVTDEYKDYHSRTFDNYVGSICKMPRNKVMDDPNQTCSTGLHFCSLNYLEKMWGYRGHTMVIKINPKDVVSIPVDYENSKGRCCRYEVVAEHEVQGKEFYNSVIHEVA